MTITIPIWGLVVIAFLFLLTFIPVALLITIASLDLYAMMHFRKNHKIDKTNIFTIWIALKWMFVAKAEEMADKLGWPQQDLSEMLGIKKDDGKIS